MPDNTNEAQDDETEIVGNIELFPIKTKEDLADNFLAFQRGAHAHFDRTLEISRRTVYWVHDVGTHTFAPNKFLGYREMSFAQYELAVARRYRGARFNGSISRAIVEEVTGSRFQVVIGLQDACLQYVSELIGKDASRTVVPDKWMFLSVSIPGREAVTGFPDEISRPERYVEGACRPTLVNAYERNHGAVEACKKHYGTQCQVCGVKLEEIYGEIARGRIHVHHTIQLASRGYEYIVDPIAHLKPVCPNCHFVLHLKSPPFEIDEVKEMRRTVLELNKL